MARLDNYGQPYNIRAHILELRETVKQYEEYKKWVLTGQGKAFWNAGIGELEKKHDALLEEENEVRRKP